MLKPEVGDQSISRLFVCALATMPHTICGDEVFLQQMYILKLQ